MEWIEIGKDTPEAFGLDEWPDIIPVDEIAAGYSAPPHPRPQ